MRYVDIEQLQLPLGWQKRADRALGAVRKEIQDAERAAQGRREDPSAARRGAIATGLAKPARQRVWQDLADALSELSWHKCWYSESRNPTADKNVDHFRPKARVAEDETHEGYWWLAFDWHNLRYASQWSNQKRNDKVNGTTGGKGDRFPLSPHSFRAREEGDDIEREEPILLDPNDSEDWKLLTFRPDGHAIPAGREGTIEYRRAAVSIEIYHLHSKALVDDRRNVGDRVRRIVQELERLRPSISDPHGRGFYKRQLQDLLRLIERGADYSAAALAHVRGELYKLERGRAVKRKWLAEILASNP